MPQVQGRLLSDNRGSRCAYWLIHHQSWLTTWPAHKVQQLVSQLVGYYQTFPCKGCAHWFTTSPEPADYLASAQPHDAPEHRLLCANAAAKNGALTGLHTLGTN